MVDIIETGEFVTVDETNGLQNFALDPAVMGDSDDNDTGLTPPSALTARLLAVQGTDYLEWIDVALSGYGAPTDTDIATAPGEQIISLTESDRTFSGLGFSSSSTGTPFPVLGGSGGIDSELTSGGVPVLLYVDPLDDNILYGVAGTEIVFALYLEETLKPDSGMVNGAKMWTVLYKPLDHGDTTTPDDALDLADKVFVSVESEQEFSLAGVPSGQNLFLMWKSTTPGSSDAIIATGINPANTSEGQALTAYETVNTGQGGGNTTLSNSSQAGLVAYTGYGTSLVYTFVKETNENFTVPQADQTEIGRAHV